MQTVIGDTLKKSYTIEKEHVRHAICDITTVRFIVMVCFFPGGKHG